MTTKAPAASTVVIEPEVARAELLGRRIGPHTPIREGLLRAAERARVVGAGVIQVFTDDPKAWAPRATPHPELERFRALLEAQDVALMVHASYLVNLATPDEAVHLRSVERMRHELRVAAAMGARAVTVHVGSHRGAGIGTGVEQTAEALARVLDDPEPSDAGPRLVLEDSAGQGDSLGVTVAELGAILDAAERIGADRRRLGVCLDTAHLWGAGVTLDDPDAVDGLLTAADDVLGADALALVHLNDSRSTCGSRMDRHEHIGEGRIGVAGLGHLVRHPRLAAVPMVLETPGMDEGWDAVNMARVRSLLRGEPWTTEAPAAGRTPDAVRATPPGGARAHILGTTPEGP
jgi:deoxyribonuclease-4